MKPAETLRGLLRRWYITFPGLVVAIAVALGAWYLVPPSYVRTSTQLLLPGKQNMPVDSNPLLFLGGLSYAADVVVRAVAAPDALAEVAKDHPGSQVDVARDGTTSAPFIVITVTARTDAEAGTILGEMVGRTSTELAQLQRQQHIPADNRITVQTVTLDGKGTVQQRNRIVAAAGAGVVVAALALLLAAMVDGLVRQRRRRAVSATSEGEGEASGEPGADQPGRRATHAELERGPDIRIDDALPPDAPNGPVDPFLVEFAAEGLDDVPAEDDLDAGAAAGDDVEAAADQPAVRPPRR